VKWRLIPDSLRLKLVLASVVVEAVMLALLVSNSLRLMETSLVEQAEVQLRQVAPLLNASLAAPLVQRDHATIREILRESRHRDAIGYLVLFDAENKLVAAEGWDMSQPLPRIAASIDERHDRFDTEIPIQLAGQRYGLLRYGVSTKILGLARTHLLDQSILIALASIGLSVVLLTLLGYWLTRHLLLLTRGAHQVAQGNFDITLPVSGNDEVGQLTTAFNRMAENIRADIEALRAGGELQLRYLLEAKREHARLNSLLSAMNIGILFVSPESRIVYCNPAFLHIWRIPGDCTALIGLPASDIVRQSADLFADPEQLSQLLAWLDTPEDSDHEHEIAMVDGRTVTSHVYPVRDAERRLVGRLWIYEDVTRERRTAQQLLFLAERDSLTGLHNRHYFLRELEKMVAESDRHRTPGALLFFDLDEFKYINDTFGHSAGDSILTRIASDIGTLVRRNETFSRLGGDEFAILAPNVTESEAQVLAEQVVRTIEKIPFRIENQNLRMTSSLGIAYYPQHATAAEELIAHADAAMYQAKDSGKNSWRVYRPDLDTSHAMVQRLSWNDRITRALENGLFQLHFQGVYHAADRTLAHLEALVRMEDQDHPGKLIMPGHFIPIAEKSGKILDIDRWVIRACIELLASSPQTPSIAVNISGRSFDEPSLPQFIEDQLKQHGVAPARLLVELTETAAVSDMQDARRFIEALRHTGCPVCLDDFGTGFSSFAYLKHLNADVLKIDGMFIRDLPNDRDNQVFVKAIVDVARGMDKITVAEFVESQEILEMLITFGVDLVQGYHLDIPRADHPALLK